MSSSTAVLITPFTKGFMTFAKRPWGVGIHSQGQVGASIRRFHGEQRVPYCPMTISYYPNAFVFDEFS